MKLDGAVAIVTGGASGLGEATVRTLVSGGARAVILDRPQSPGEALASELGAKSAIFAPADVTSEDEVAKAGARATDPSGAVQLPVNCPGGAIPGGTRRKPSPP